MQNIVDYTKNNKCSRCTNCCSLFIPFTEDELNIIKEYVTKYNIKPINQISEHIFKLKCCFCDEVNHKCLIYPVRPYACKHFICNDKNWKENRDVYEKRAKYNSSLNKINVATFDDKVYGNYEPLINYIINQCPKQNNEIDDKDFVNTIKLFGREDLFNLITLYDENDNEIKI